VSPRIQYRALNLRPKALAAIEQANAIIAEYSAQGFDLTLRQLFYQFVARGLIANTQREYKNLGNVVNDGRLAGLVDWEAIVDRTRNLRSLSHWTSPQQIVRSCAQQFNYNLWATQPAYVEVWIEKDALVGVIEGVCNRWDVPHFSCRGYTSQSEMWAAGQRIARAATGDGPTVVLHLGDHDPSGVDMTRDIQDRLTLFADGEPIEVRRLALNTDQVRQYNPPPNPAKITDSRARDYIRRHGRESWELDALDPNVIEGLIETELAKLIDVVKWDEAKERQNRARAQLGSVADKWQTVIDTIGK
jgi:hypothetical protein